MTTSPLAIEDRRELAAFLEGRSNTEIDEIAASAGVDKVLARVFEVMQNGYDTTRAPSDPVVVQWEIKDAAGTLHHWCTRANRDDCMCDGGTAERADVTLRLSLVTFLMIMSGRMKGMKALSTGKLKLKGDLLLATSIEKWFRTD